MYLPAIKQNNALGATILGNKAPDKFGSSGSLTVAQNIGILVQIMLIMEQLRPTQNPYASYTNPNQPNLPSFYSDWSGNNFQL